MTLPSLPLSSMVQVSPKEIEPLRFTDWTWACCTWIEDVSGIETSSFSPENECPSVDKIFNFSPLLRASYLSSLAIFSASLAATPAKEISSLSSTSIENSLRLFEPSVKERTQVWSFLTFPDKVNVLAVTSLGSATLSSPAGFTFSPPKENFSVDPIVITEPSTETSKSLPILVSNPSATSALSSLDWTV